MRTALSTLAKLFSPRRRALPPVQEPADMGTCMGLEMILAAAPAATAPEPPPAAHGPKPSRAPAPQPARSTARPAATAAVPADTDHAPLAA